MTSILRAPWRFQTPLQKVFLPDAVKAHRLRMASHLLAEGRDAAWFSRHVVWFDPCASIIPGSQRQYDLMRQACKSRKRWMSNDAKLYSPNLPGPPTALKQKGWEGKKVNWFVVLTRGAVHVETMPEDWTLDGAGLASFVKRLPSVFRKMLGRSARVPRILFTDRGTGMYAPTGRIVEKYARAVKSAGFHVHWGDDASQQSPDLGDVVLHETAVAWIRARLRKEKPVGVPWEESQQQWSQRVRRVVKRINETYDVNGLCSEFPERLEKVVAGEGERLRK